MIRSYVPSRYGQLHYRIAQPSRPATRPPLLCLHQTPANGRDWEPILDELADARVVIAPDTPGYGMSDPPPEPTTIEDFAAIMARFVDDLGFSGAFDVMGMHTGSVIAVELALRLPARVRRLVLFGVAAFPAETRADMLARLRESFPVPAGDLSHVEKLWGIIAQLSDPRLDAETRHVRMAECLRLGSRMPWGYISVYRYDFLAALAEVEQPALVVNPEDDLWEVTRQTSGLLKHGRRWDIPGVRHGVLTLEKARVLTEIEAFLAG